MKTLPPSAVDAEFRALCLNDSDSDGIKLLRFLFVWIDQQLQTGNNFELLQAYLYRAALIYSEVLRKHTEFTGLLVSLKESHRTTSSKFRDLVQSNLCLLKLFARISFST